MNAKKQTLCFLLAVMLISVGCASDAEDTNPVITNGTNPDTVAAQETESLYEADALPALDYGGEDFTVFVEDYGGYSAADFFVSEATGDIVDDAVWDRNRAVSERLNINLLWDSMTHYWDDRATYTTHVKSSVMAGDGAYDLLAGLGYFVPNFITDGILLDLSGLPYIDIDKPWWSRAFMETATVDGKYHFATGDISLGYIKNMFCIFYNLGLASSLDIENAYDLVKDGKWTVDKLTEIIKGTYNDLNGNGKKDAEDRFGLLVNHGNHIHGFTEALGIDYITFASGEPKFIFDNEHNFEVMEDLHELFWKNEDAFFDKKGEAETAFESIFRNENIVFATGWFMHTDAFRDLEWDFGVLPYPKWEETEESYKTSLLTSYSVVAIPTDCQNTERAAAVCEALGSESYRTVTPAYFETALKVKYSRDNESAQMFDIIRAGVDFDFAFIYTMPLGGINGDLFAGYLNQEGNKSWVANTERIKKSAEKKISELMEAIREVQ